MTTEEILEIRRLYGKRGIGFKEFFAKQKELDEAILKKHGIDSLTYPMFECPPGWCQIVDRALGDMINMGWDKRLAQVKQKFCELRIYYDCRPEQRDFLEAVVERAEREAAVTCEVCGEPRRLVGPKSGRGECVDCEALWKT